MFSRLSRSVIAIGRVSTSYRFASTSHVRLGKLFSPSYAPTIQVPSSDFKLLNHVEKLEEENWDWYTADSYYQVRIGQIFRSRYQVLGKLGYGAHSTVWLGRDLHAHRFVALKICELNSQSAQRELAAYQHIGPPIDAHAGSRLIRQLLDSFTINVAAGKHLCLVHEPLGLSLEIFVALLPGQRLAEDLLKQVLIHLLLVLDYLHSQRQMIHTDLQARNIHFGLEEDSMLQHFASDEIENPSPRKIDGERVIYETKGVRMPKETGRPILMDFGEARYGETTYTDDIQPFLYRAPEVILDMPWSYEVDIWSVGVIIWDLFESRHLFKAEDSSGDQSMECHLAEMCAMLGPPPLDFLQRTETSWKYFEADGTWKGAASIPDISLETMETRLDGHKKVQFLTFVRKMLQWQPEERETARQLLEDPWLNS